MRDLFTTPCTSREFILSLSSIAVAEAILLPQLDTACQPSMSSSGKLLPTAEPEERFALRWEMLEIEGRRLALKEKKVALRMEMLEAGVGGFIDSEEEKVEPMKRGNIKVEEEDDDCVIVSADGEPVGSANGASKRKRRMGGEHDEGRRSRESSSRELDGTKRIKGELVKQELEGPQSRVEEGDLGSSIQTRPLGVDKKVGGREADTSLSKQVQVSNKVREDLV